MRGVRGVRVVVAVVLGRRGPGNADLGLARVTAGAPGVVVLLGGPSGGGPVVAAVVVVVAAGVVAARGQGVSGRRLGEGHLPLVAPGEVGGLGVSQDLGPLQGAVSQVAHGARAGDVVQLLVAAGGGGSDVDGQLRAPRHGLRGLGAPAAHDGAGLGEAVVVVVGGAGAGGAQLAVVDAGGGHGVAVGGVGGPAGPGGVGGGVHILHLEGPLQSCSVEGEREGENRTDSIKGQWASVNQGHQTHSARRHFDAKPQHPITM